MSGLSELDARAEELTPWQQRIVKAFLEPTLRRIDLPLMEQRARRNGRAAQDRKCIEDMASLAVHIHVAGRDGSWCVTRQPVGFLWAKLPAPRGGPVYEIEDEMRRLARG